MFLFIGIFIILLQDSSGVEIISIHSVPDEITVSAGSRLLIPCRLITNRPNHRHDIQMEWGMMPDNGGDYRPLVSINVARVKRHNERAQIFQPLIRRGNCSLVVSPVTTDDSGFYEVHLRSDGKEYEPTPVVYVNVSDGSGASPVATESQTGEKNQQGKESRVLKPGSRTTKVTTMPDLVHRQRQRKVTWHTIYQIVATTVSAIVLLAAIGLAIYMARALKEDLQDEMVLLEEGRGGIQIPGASTTSSESSSTSLPSASQDSSSSSVTPVPVTTQESSDSSAISVPSASEDSFDSSVSLPTATPEPSAASVIPTPSDTSVPSAVFIEMPTSAASEASFSIVVHMPSATSVPSDSVVESTSATSSEPSVGTVAPTPSATSATSELSVSRKEVPTPSTTSLPSGSLVVLPSATSVGPSVDIVIPTATTTGKVPSTSASSVPSEGLAPPPAAGMPGSCSSGSISITVPPELAGTKSPVTVLLHVPPAREGHDACTCRPSMYNITLLPSPTSSSSWTGYYP